MPAGNSVNWVWRIDSPNYSYTNAIFNGNPMTITTGTICTRLYQTFSSDFPPPTDPTPNSRAKLQEFGLGSAYQQTEWFESGSHRVSDSLVMFNINQSVGYYGTPNAGTLTGQQVDFTDCQNSWCRFEQCLDVASNGNITGRVRAVVVNTGKTMTLTGGQATHLGPAIIDRVWIGNLYRQNSSQGSRYFSYGMQAFWPQASGAAWIGPAYEVEGGAATAPPPSGSQPPPAPVLLP